MAIRPLKRPRRGFRGPAGCVIVGFSLWSPTSRAPLYAGLTSKHGNANRSFKDGETARKNQGPTQRSVNVCVYRDFMVGMNNWFDLQRLLCDNSESGITHTTFHSLRDFHYMTLSEEALRILILPNAGGNSVVSEVLSYEMMKKCFRAELLKTEMEVKYFPYGGSITDYVARINDTTIGVSVTRAMKFNSDFEEADGIRLLSKKLRGVNQSTQNSQEKWQKQILHIWAENQNTANVLEKVYDKLDADLRSNTFVLVTMVREGRESGIFRNER